MKKKYTNFVYYIILILIPFLFFIILESSLNLFNYGIDTSTWIKINETHYGLNSKVANRYFSSENNIPEPIQDVFAIQKKKNTYRIFVLGGSSAAGFPFMPLGSFSRYIRQRLEINYPHINIEVVNLGLSAVNSYTLLDFIPDVLDQEPDLILVYAGHNEYYGALGIGSMESLGHYRPIVKLVMKLNKYKTTQLIKNIIKEIFSIFSDSEELAKGTLMSRMAKNQNIKLNSDDFRKGILQFKENMIDILTSVKRSNVPIIISTLVSNLKDQAPFYSENNKKSIAVYQQGQIEFDDLNYSVADSLFRLAKDLDQIRFRAPEEINNTIREIGFQINIPLLDVDSILNNESPGRIIGDNLLVDHLHLSLKGYQEIGKLFYDKMFGLKLLPNNSKFLYPEQDSLTLAQFHFGELDSTISNFQIRLLKNDWPFINTDKKKSASSFIQLKNKVDSLAFKYINGKENWEKLHRILAIDYIKNGDFEKGKKIFELLIHQYPLVTDYIEYISEQLISRNRFSEATIYLDQGNKIRPNDYFNKWLGIINLSNGNIDTSIYYLEKSLAFNGLDAQVFYNLSGAYVKKQNYEHALKLIDKCLELNPDYSAALILKEQLYNAVKK